MFCLMLIMIVSGKCSSISGSVTPYKVSCVQEGSSGVKLRQAGLSGVKMDQVGSS